MIQVTPQKEYLVKDQPKYKAKVIEALLLRGLKEQGAYIYGETARFFVGDLRTCWDSFINGRWVTMGAFPHQQFMEDIISKLKP